MKSLWMDEGGAVLTIELLLLVVILVIGLITGLVALRDAVVTQLGELAISVASIDTSFEFDGLAYVQGDDAGITGSAAGTAGSARTALYTADNVAVAVNAGLQIDPIPGASEKGVVAN